MPPDESHEARVAAEMAARTSYGRLLAALIRRTRDIASAEDALADAFRTALETWPARGVPDSPDAWLLTVARRSAGRGARHRKVADKAASAIVQLQEEALDQTLPAIPDERLRLMFICAHPAIDEAARTPLMLQTVLGLDAARIAAAFMTAPSAMSQRLVRAKAKIRDAGIAFETPALNELPNRLDAVLSAIYAAYSAGWDDALGADPRRRDLSGEALFLVRLVTGLMPDEPEARGLLALILYCEARQPARRQDGAFVPLSEQDAHLWSAPMIMAAERELVRASAAKTFGRFQTEAAIQSVHCQRAITGTTNWAALATLYDLLAARAPTLGNLVARGAVHGKCYGAAAGLAVLDLLDSADMAAYQPYWATRAALLAEAGDGPAAAQAFERAAGLSDDPAVRAFLTARRARAIAS